MIPVSNAWVEAQKGLLSPEGFIEISCHISDLSEPLVYTKGDIMSFVHQQTGSLVSGELPKNHIEFSLDNSDGKWNPHNPESLVRYLSERQKITLRYGLDINGVTEWIPGGVFYLSEWNTPANGLEVSFVARDILEYMMDTPYTGAMTGTLYEIAQRAVAEAALPDDAVVSLCSELNNYSVDEITNDGTQSVAEILQKCANAAQCVMYQNRDGVLVIERRNYSDSGYTIPMSLSYTLPEVEFLRPLKAVSVEYSGDNKVQYTYSGSGETQTVSNDFISEESQAHEVAIWVCECLRTRRQIKGEFRGEPRLDLFDTVSVDNKYGQVKGVVITDIKISFTGAFKTTYSGYISISGVITNIYFGEIYVGEVQ